MSKTIPTSGQGQIFNRSKAPAFRITRTGDIMPSTIDMMSKITVDPSMKAALTAASVKLVVEIDAAGTRVFLADQRTSQIVGGPEDLQRIGGIRAFVNRERKEANALDSGNTVNRVAYLASAYALAKDQGYQQMPLESSFNAAVKPILSVLDRLGTNENKLDENKNLTNRELPELYLRSQFSRIRKAYLEHVLALVKGEAKKGHLSEMLFNFGVPEYMHAKLINNNLVIDKTQDLNRVIFPADPSKGITLTLKEWRSAAFRLAQGTILEESAIPLSLANSDQLIRAICRFDDDTDLTDLTNQSVALAMKGKLYVTFPHQDRRYVTSAGAKVKSNGWKFPAVNMENPKGAVSAIGLAVLRVYAANLQTVDLVKDYYSIICPGVIKVSEISPTNNMYAQWEKALSPEGHCASHWFVTTGKCQLARRQKTADWIATELRLPCGGPTRKLINEALGLTPGGQMPPGSPVNADGKSALPSLAAEEADEPVTLSTAEVNFTRELTPAEVPLAIEFKGHAFGGPKVKRQGRQPNAALTPLTKHSIALVERVGRLSPYLKMSLTNWLRGFTDARVQTAAARLAIASFDELFLSEGLYSDDAESLPGLDFDQSNWADEMNETEE